MGRVPPSRVGRPTHGATHRFNQVEVASRSCCAARRGSFTSTTSCGYRALRPAALQGAAGLAALKATPAVTASLRSALTASAHGGCITPAGRDGRMVFSRTEGCRGIWRGCRVRRSIASTVRTGARKKRLLSTRMAPPEFCHPGAGCAAKRGAAARPSCARRWPQN